MKTETWQGWRKPPRQRSRECRSFVEIPRASRRSSWRWLHCSIAKHLWRVKGAAVVEEDVEAQEAVAGQYAVVCAGWIATLQSELCRRYTNDYATTLARVCATRLPVCVTSYSSAFGGAGFRKPGETKHRKREPSPPRDHAKRPRSADRTCTEDDTTHLKRELPLWDAVLRVIWNQ